MSFFLKSSSFLIMFPILGFNLGTAQISIFFHADKKCKTIINTKTWQQTHRKQLHNNTPATSDTSQQKQHKAQRALQRSKEKCHTESVWKGSYPFPWLFGALRKCLSSVKQCKCLSSLLASPHLVWTNKLSRTKREEKKDEKREGVLDLKRACCRLGKPPDKERERMREREGANCKSRCGSHPSTPPKHPQAASSAVLQLHVWGSTLPLFPYFLPPKKPGSRSPRASVLGHSWRIILVTESSITWQWEVVSDKSSLPSVEEEDKNEMNRGVSEEGEERSGEVRREPQWNFTGRSAQWLCVCVCVCATTKNVHKSMRRSFDSHVCATRSPLQHP